MLTHAARAAATQPLCGRARRARRALVRAIKGILYTLTRQLRAKSVALPNQVLTQNGRVAPWLSSQQDCITLALRAPYGVLSEFPASCPNFQPRARGSYWFDNAVAASLLIVGLTGDARGLVCRGDTRPARGSKLTLLSQRER